MNGTLSSNPGNEWFVYRYTFYPTFGGFESPQTSCLNNYVHVVAQSSTSLQNHFRGLSGLQIVITLVATVITSRAFLNRDWLHVDDTLRWRRTAVVVVVTVVVATTTAAARTERTAETATEVATVARDANGDTHWRKWKLEVMWRLLAN